MSLFTNETDTRKAAEGLALLVKEAHDNAVAHGFYSDHDTLLSAVGESRRSSYDAYELAHRNFVLAQLAKVASEVGEAVSAIQKGESFIEELADTIIRTLDLGGFCSKHSGAFADVIIDKMIKNRSRPYLHGKLC